MADSNRLPIVGRSVGEHRLFELLQLLFASPLPALPFLTDRDGIDLSSNDAATNEAPSRTTYARVGFE